jgi:hypothetical protein
MDVPKEIKRFSCYVKISYATNVTEWRLRSTKMVSLRKRCYCPSVHNSFWSLGSWPIGVIYGMIKKWAWKSLEETSIASNALTDRPIQVSNAAPMESTLKLATPRNGFHHFFQVFTMSHEFSFFVFCLPNT